MSYKFEHAIKVLEFDKVIDLLAQETSTVFGKELAFKVSPLGSIEECYSSFRLTEEIKTYFAYNGALPIENIFDIRSALDEAKKEIPLREEILYHFLLFSEAVSKLSGISSKLSADRFPNLKKLISDFVVPTSILAEFPRFLEQPGKIKDNATAKLAAIVSRKRLVYAKIQESLTKMISSPSFVGFLQDKVITTRNGRFVLLVRAEAKHHIKGIVHDRSSSGATLYIEPLSILPLNNELRELEIEEQEEKNRIRQYLTGIIKSESDKIEPDISIIAMLDLAQAKARLAERFSSLPVELVSPSEPIVLRRAFHPILLEEARKRGNFVAVPLDFEQEKGVKCVIITGPNMGGKTVVLKTIGILTIMAMSGLEIPASPGSRIPFFNEIVADIGEEQSIEFSLSSFSSHIKVYKCALENAKDGLLALFDEIGSSTDPDEGAVLAESILTTLVERGATVIATTHLGQLKVLPSKNPFFSNAGMEFDELELKPTYRLRMGQPGRSWAFHIAERLGIEPMIIEQARKLRSADTLRFESVSAELEKKIREIEIKQKNLKEIEDNLQKDREFLASLIRANEAKMKELERARVELAEKKERMLEEFLAREKRRIIEEITVRTGNTQSPSELKHAAEKTISRKIKSLKELRTQAMKKSVIMLKPGDRVFVEELKKYAEVLEGTDKNGYAKVLVDGVKMRIHTSLLKIEAHKEEKPKPSGIQYERKDLPVVLDFRGFTLEDVKKKLIPYIDQAVAQSLKSFVIVHGQGKGRLGDKVREFLKSEPRIKEFRVGEANEGGAGVTIVTLKTFESANKNDKLSN